MSNGKLKTIWARRTVEWDNFLDSVIEKIMENGYDKKLFKTYIERLILKHANIKIIEQEIIGGFQGVKEPRQEVEEWMKGK